MGAALLLGAGIVVAAGGVDDALAGWLGREITIESSSIDDQIPVGGKLTFIYDSSDDVVRVCTRQVTTQRRPWRSDFASPCSVTLVFTRGTRYCSLEDVKAGNGEVLSQCHRMRSREVALTQATSSGLELHDVIVFLHQAPNNKHVISILVDTPARVTGGGIGVGRD
ncbi:MAG TPA: hypothetical protein VFZ95_03685 [Steroidobacteraceae bacterium]